MLNSKIVFVSCKYALLNEEELANFREEPDMFLEQIELYDDDSVEDTLWTSCLCWLNPDWKVRFHIFLQFSILVIEL